MKKKTNIRTVIRKIVREEVAMVINEVITELKKPNQPQQPQKQIVEKKSFTKNSILNDVLNETAQDEEWKTMGGEKYTTKKINDLVGSEYGDMMNSNSNIPVSVDGQTPDFLKKDYRAVMNAIDKKQGK
tara:strand:+ start:289 stop:675 length:387 start_codon:yes stop_codon:yes gene_type:complete